MKSTSAPNWNQNPFKLRCNNSIKTILVSCETSTLSGSHASWNWKTSSTSRLELIPHTPLATKRLHISSIHGDSQKTTSSSTEAAKTTSILPIRYSEGDVGASQDHQQRNNSRAKCKCTTFRLPRWQTHGRGWTRGRLRAGRAAPRAR